MYKEDLALNNRQWLICHKTHPKQTKPSVEKRTWRIGKAKKKKKKKRDKYLDLARELRKL